jgi:ankyrin repeat protein
LISTEDVPAKLIDLLVKNGAPLNNQNNSGSTPLHLAAFWGHFSVVKLLVEEGAKLDIKNEKGRTALDVSALYGHKQIAEYLSQKSNKPMPKIKGKERKTLTMYAPAEPPNPDKIKP